MARLTKKNRLQQEMHETRRRRVRMVLGVLGVSLITGLLMVAYFKVLDENSFPIRTVKISGEFEYMDTDALKTIMHQQLNRNFFNIDIEGIRASVKQVPWVDRILIRRKWPDTLVLDLEEQQALASWAKGGFINQRGEWFDAESEQLRQKLPVLSGPKRMAAVLAKRYVEMQNSLSASGLKLVRVNMTHRRSWDASLDNGLQIKLGRLHVQSRLRRFVNVYQRVVESQLSKIEGVDMRYTNGFAVRWKPGNNNSDKPRGAAENA